MASLTPLSNHLCSESSKTVSPADQNYIMNMLFDDTWMIDNIHTDN